MFFQTARTSKSGHEIQRH